MLSAEKTLLSIFKMCLLHSQSNTNKHTPTQRKTRNVQIAILFTEIRDAEYQQRQ